MQCSSIPAAPSSSSQLLYDGPTLQLLPQRCPLAHERLIHPHGSSGPPSHCMHKVRLVGREEGHGLHSTHSTAQRSRQLGAQALSSSTQRPDWVTAVCWGLLPLRASQEQETIDCLFHNFESTSCLIRPSENLPTSHTCLTRSCTSDTSCPTSFRASHHLQQTSRRADEHQVLWLAPCAVGCLPAC